MKPRMRGQVRGAVQLLGEATQEATGIVEAMHARLSPLGGRRGSPPGVRARGLSGFVYGAVRGIARLATAAADRLLHAPSAAPEREEPAGPHAVRSALNGVLGHHLEARGNALAIRMSLHDRGRPLVLEPEPLQRLVPAPGGRVLVLVHGLCMSERQWLRRGHDHGAALAADLGYTPIYLNYNTGLHISRNGQALADLLERLVDAWPHPLSDLTLLCHSAGGLVARSACHHATLGEMRWPGKLRHLVFLGTPHLGSPLERAGNRLHAALAGNWFTAPLGRLGILRSAGITDLRYGGVTGVHEVDADRFAATRRPDPEVPLPAGVRCFAAAATLGRRPGDLRDRMLGDGLVPVSSALGRGRAGSLIGDPEREWVGCGLGHLDLLSDPAVYHRIRDWLAYDPDAESPLLKTAT